MQASTFTLRSTDGTEIHVYRWLPESEPRAVLQVAHGMAEHAGRYARFAEAAVGAGFAVYADDHRGHGLTPHTSDDLGYFAASQGWRQVLDDLYRLADHITGAHPGVPRVMFGHSMGSFFTQQMLYERGDSLCAAILSGSSSGVSNPLAPIGRVIARIERMRVGPRGRSPLLTRLSFGNFNNAFKPTRTDFDWLSRDPAEVDLYVADPLCGFDITTQMWIDVLEALPGLADPANLARIPKGIPLYVTSGSDDPVHSKMKGLQRLVDDYGKAGLRNLTWKVWSGSRHELLNETCRDEVTAAILRWIDEVALAEPR